MASARQCLGIDIGTHSIRIAEVTVSPEGIKIDNLIEERIKIDPSQKEGERHATIAAQISELIKTHKIKSKQAVFCIPGQTVFVRRLNLPATAPDRLDRIVRFEAKEQIPFPLEKTILEYQVFPTENPEEVEVLLVAIKRDYIDNFRKLVRKIGLSPLAISVSSLALNNFHEVNTLAERIMERIDTGKESRKDKAKSKKSKGFSLKFGKKKGAAGQEPEEPQPEEPQPEESDPYESMELEEIQAQVNLGATIMDLAIPKAGSQRMIGFVRSVPVAGSQIDRTIKTNLDLGTLEEARKLKEEQAVILASDFEIAGDAGSVNMDASQAATTVVNRIIAELRRSLDFFISQPDGVAVDSIVLSGGLARMRYLSNYIEEKMGLPVELAEAKNPKLEVADNLKGAMSCFTIPLGLAFQGLDLCQIKIDFLSQEIKNIRAFKDKRLQLAAMVVLVLASIGFGLTTGGKTRARNRALVDELSVEVGRARDTDGKVNQAETRNRDLAVKYDRLSEETLDRRFELDFAVTIHDQLPPDAFVELFKFSRDGKVDLRVVTPHQGSVTQLVESLNALVSEETQLNRVTLGGLRDRLGDARFDGRVTVADLQILSRKREGRYRSLRNSLARGVSASGTTGGDEAALAELFGSGFIGF